MGVIIEEPEIKIGRASNGFVVETCRKAVRSFETLDSMQTFITKFVENLTKRVIIAKGEM